MNTSDKNEYTGKPVVHISQLIILQKPCTQNSNILNNFSLETVCTLNTWPRSNSIEHTCTSYSFECKVCYYIKYQLILALELHLSYLSPLHAKIYICFESGRDHSFITLRQWFRSLFLSAAPIRGRYSVSSASISPYPYNPTLSHQPSACPPSLRPLIFSEVFHFSSCLATPVGILFSDIRTTTALQNQTKPSQLFISNFVKNKKQNK